MPHLLEVRMGNRGKREFTQVLRLLEALALDAVMFAITEAALLCVMSFDAVKPVALGRTERRPVRRDLAPIHICRGRR